MAILRIRERVGSLGARGAAANARAAVEREAAEDERLAAALARLTVPSPAGERAAAARAG